MTVQEMKAQREKEELSEFERLRLKAQEKQRAKLTAIRQAESDMVAKSIQRKSNTINRRINGRSNDTQMDDIRERHKKKQLAKKGKMEQTRRKKEKKLRNQELMNASTNNYNNMPTTTILPPMNTSSANNVQQNPRYE